MFWQDRRIASNCAHANTNCQCNVFTTSIHHLFVYLPTPVKPPAPLGSGSTVLRAICIISASNTFVHRATVLRSRVYSLYWFDASDTFCRRGSVLRSRASIRGTCLIAQLPTISFSGHSSGQIMKSEIYEVDAQFFLHENGLPLAKWLPHFDWARGVFSQRKQERRHPSAEF